MGMVWIWKNGYSCASPLKNNDQIAFSITLLLLLFVYFLYCFFVNYTYKLLQKKEWNLAEAGVLIFALPLFSFLVGSVAGYFWSIEVSFMLALLVMSALAGVVILLFVIANFLTSKKVKNPLIR
jgi:hypothetical protein